ncbi:cell division protein FtsX [Xanthovirga aplysinae]|uniref:cell division protein FtsX n=1 Tax=Xanthovirga aplysinae TaxID=2529853 RepID=UPI0012BB58C9|nr:permease-like cell division protein FtsX [Xanthovirga aplysinae]MTI29899.1 FtsX-like permease family protein [Xanthovirga aplysinae]
MKESPKNRNKKKAGSYPYASVLFSIFLALIVFGLFGLLLLHTQKLTSIIRENIEVQVYLNKHITENERTKIGKTLALKDFTAKKENQALVTLIPKEEAAEKFIKETGEDFTEFLGENPLRDTYTIKIASEFQTKEKLNIIEKEISAINGVYEVSYVENLVESIQKNLAKIGLVLIGLLIILLTTVVILINNTIKLALFSQRFLIRSMQLIGSTDRFIRKPFLMRSLGHGLLAGLLASLALFGILQYANHKVADLKKLQDLYEILILFGGLIVLGAFISFISTFRAVKKYLKLSLDELY